MSEGGDLASAETELPMAPDAIAAFVADVERLLRLNPLLAIERWAPEGPGCFRLVARNESNEQVVDTPVDIEADVRSLTLRYASGLKQATCLQVETAPQGSRLLVTEHYPYIEDARDPRVVEVDRSLVPWVAAIRRHLLSRARWGRLPLVFPIWQWWQERVMLSMAPRHRRIVRLIVWLSVIEFVVFIGMVAVLRLAA